jgi:hypothetical protein
LAVGYTHASKVIADVTFNDADPAMLTRLLTPLKSNALPYLPEGVHVAPLIVPVFPLPDASATVVPVPSLKLYAATNPVEGGALDVVVVPTLEYPLKFAAASVARTR